MGFEKEICNNFSCRKFIESDLESEKCCEQIKKRLN